MLWNAPKTERLASISSLIGKFQSMKLLTIHEWIVLIFGFISINYLLIIVSTNWNRSKHCVTSLQCSGTFQIVTAIDFLTSIMAMQTIKSLKYSFCTRIFYSFMLWNLPKTERLASISSVIGKFQSMKLLIIHEWIVSVFGFISINYLLIIVSTNWNRPKHCVTSLQCSGTFQIVTAINIQQVLWQCKRLSLINIRFILVFL